jgi:hypothetical protein
MDGMVEPQFAPAEFGQDLRVKRHGRRYRRREFRQQSNSAIVVPKCQWPPKLWPQG